MIKDIALKLEAGLDLQAKACELTDKELGGAGLDQGGLTPPAAALLEPGAINITALNAAEEGSRAVGRGLKALIGDIISGVKEGALIAADDRRAKTAIGIYIDLHRATGGIAVWLCFEINRLSQRRGEGAEEGSEGEERGDGASQPIDS